MQICDSSNIIKAIYFFIFFLNMLATILAKCVLYRIVAYYFKPSLYLFSVVHLNFLKTFSYLNYLKLWVQCIRFACCCDIGKTTRDSSINKIIVVVGTFLWCRFCDAKKHRMILFSDIFDSRSIIAMLSIYVSMNDQHLCVFLLYLYCAYN